MRIDTKFIINKQTGMICNDNNFEAKLNKMVLNYEGYLCRKWYDTNLSASKIAGRVLRAVKNGI